MHTTGRRAWLDAADLLLSLALLVVAVGSAVESRWGQSALAVVLALAWAGAVAWRHRRAVRAAASAPAPATTG
ncbi:hypothetical protein [Kineococcus aurantiacus]|uniref:Uncharacterized protein n=1 Tax=Kineococcus aurantiacus TaxID=37633 RepID=A0A7Y9DNK2_9ACTN|nr:hypothetical protein [Kineococcus aurantiacus]NYD23819.1 hypothetical protein [Kineococcus aurantiacus]